MLSGIRLNFINFAKLLLVYMKHLRRIKLLVYLLTLTFIASCEDEVVGKWETMKWDYKNISEGIKVIKSAGTINKRNVTEFEVLKSGSIDIVCKNYKGFWFQDYPEMSLEEDSLKQFSRENCKMKIEGNILHCEFIGIDGQQADEFKVVVTAGDIFYQFNFKII